MAQASAVQAKTEVRFNRFLAMVYPVMAIGMVVTALVPRRSRSSRSRHRCSC